MHGRRAKETSLAAFVLRLLWRNDLRATAIHHRDALRTGAQHSRRVYIILLILCVYCNISTGRLLMYVFHVSVGSLGTGHFNKRMSS